VNSAPLVVSADADLVDAALHVAASVLIEPEVQPGPETARPRWGTAGLVVVGADQLESLARSRLPRREGVVALAIDPEDTTVWRRALEAGAAQVFFHPDEAERLAGLFAAATHQQGEPAHAVGVVGGRGGAGASTLATALAVTAARVGRRPLLVDLDPLGGGLDLMFGARSVSGLRWPDLAGARGRLAPAALTAGLPVFRGVPVLSWDGGDSFTVPAAAGHAVVGCASVTGELVVYDLPRRVDDLVAVALAAIRVLLVVVPAELRAAAAAARVVALFGWHCPDIRLVVRQVARGGPSLATVAQTVGVPVAGQLRDQPQLRRAAELGRPPGRWSQGSLASFCTGFLAALTGPAAAGG
jgi:secretion/DNA translocation related CpaE-like protein